MDIFEIYVSGMANTVAAYFKNLPDKLSIPVALFVWQFFKRFKMKWPWII